MVATKNVDARGEKVINAFDVALGKDCYWPDPGINIRKLSHLLKWSINSVLNSNCQLLRNTHGQLWAWHAQLRSLR
jgi:hypothetical protein